MSSHSRAVGRSARTRRTHPLGDVENDASEAILIQVDFLVVGNLSNGAKGGVSTVK